MAYQSINPYDGKTLKTFEEFTDQQLDTAIQTAPKDVLAPGDKVLVRIIEINTEREPVSLSMRRVPQDDLAHWIMESQQDDSFDDKHTDEE